MSYISRRSFTLVTMLSPLTGRAARLGLGVAPAESQVSAPPIDGPDGLPIEWIPAPYEQYGPGLAKYGNHDIAHRPSSPLLTRVVIHDTEETYDTTIKLVQKPSYLAWNYTLRSSDGHVAQHLDPHDVGWHSGNWYYNMHATGLEHEGRAVEGMSWYTDAMYRSSAALVRHLCRKYSVPMTRGHIIGHDEVPGIDTEHIKTMHWDPGPYWNWARYFELLGCPLTDGTTDAEPQPGDVVRILPDFASNTQVYDGRVVTGLNFVTARQAPSQDAPAVVDIGIRPGPATTEPSDVGARLNTGAEYVVAEVGGQDDEWIAVWYLGTKAWLHNPWHVSYRGRGRSGWSPARQATDEPSRKPPPTRTPVGCSRTPPCRTCWIPISAMSSSIPSLRRTTTVPRPSAPHRPRITWTSSVRIDTCVSSWVIAKAT